MTDLIDWNDANTILKYRAILDKYAPSVVDEGVPTSAISCTAFSNTTFSTLITSVNSYLSSSGRRFRTVVFYGAGVVTTTHYAIIQEIG